MENSHQMQQVNKDHITYETKTLSVCSYNCTGFKKKIDYVDKLLLENDIDVLCLQETWLLNKHTHYLGQTGDKKYQYTGNSGMDCCTDILLGRPYGGVGILWKTSLSHRVTPLKLNHKRLCGITIQGTVGVKTLILCVYMPNDNYHATNVNPDFDNVLDMIENIMNAENYHGILLCGDWNTDFKRSNAQSKSLSEFLCRNNLRNEWDHPKSYVEDTYRHLVLNQSSCIDHYFASHNVFDTTVNCSVLCHVENRSFHCPVVLELNFNLDQLKCGKVNPVKRIQWHKVHEGHVLRYKEKLDLFLRKINIDTSCLTCMNPTCNVAEHFKYIDEFCNRLIGACVDAGNDVFPVSSRFRAMPGWKEKCSPAKETALFWHWLWCEMGKPKEGTVAQIMRSTRGKYHQEVKSLRKDENKLRKEKFVNSVVNNESRKFWVEVKKINGSHKISSKVIDGRFDDTEISELFAEKYEQLYNSVPTDQADLRELNSSLLNDIQKIDKISELRVTVNDVMKAVSQLNAGKSDGDASTYSNHFLFASHLFMVHFSLLFQCMLVHGYTADKLLHSVITSIPKDLRSSLCDSNNYRGIALCSALCKVVDIRILDKYRAKLCTSNLQFAFKENHSTVMCTGVMKETINYYIHNNSDVFTCLLDASKAFDRVHYGKLFKLLIERDIPSLVVRFILDSYTRQKVQASWNGCKSRPITTGNGVRQGGVLSPVLFSIYFDELLQRLRQCPAGCRIGGSYIGALAYADDVTLLCPSLHGMQKMIDVCETFADEFDVIFNSKKTVCIKFGNNIKLSNRSSLYLNGSKLSWSENAKHLGNYINTCANDDIDISKKAGEFISSVNRLMANFGFLPSSIIQKLFSNYCCSFYGSQIWEVSAKAIPKLCTTWNKAIRKIWKLPNTTHTNLLTSIANQMHVKEQLVCRFAKFVHKMQTCSNPIVYSLLKMSERSVFGSIGKNIAYMKAVYGCDVTKLSVHQVRTKLHQQDKQVYANGSTVKELCECRDGLKTIDDVSIDDINELIHCTT